MSEVIRQNFRVENPCEDNESKKEYLNWFKRFRSLFGITAECLKGINGHNTGCDHLNFYKIHTFALHRSRMDKIMLQVQKVMTSVPGEKEDPAKIKGQQLLKQKQKLFQKIKELKHKIQETGNVIGELECDTETNFIDPSFSSSSSVSNADPNSASLVAANEVKIEVDDQSYQDREGVNPQTSTSNDSAVGENSSEPSDNRKKICETAKLRHFEWFSAHLKNRNYQKHFVYVVFHPITGKIMYVGESSDVHMRIRCHRKKLSPLCQIFKGVDVAKGVTIFTGSYYACKAVEACILNLQKELGLELLNRHMEPQSAKLSKVTFTQVQTDIQSVIAKLPIGSKEKHHQKLVNAIKFILLRAEQFGERINHITEKNSGVVVAARNNFDQRERDGIDEEGLDLDTQFAVIEDEPHMSALDKFIDKWKSFRRAYGLDQKDIVWNGQEVISRSLVSRFETKRRNRVDWQAHEKRVQAKLEKFMKDYAGANKPVKKTLSSIDISMVTQCLEKRISNYELYCNYLEDEHANQLRKVEELRFQKEVQHLIFSPETDIQPKAETSTPHDAARDDYIWFRRILKDFDGKIHYVYGFNDANGNFVYIGESHDIVEREREHRNHPGPLYKWIRECTKEYKIVQLYYGSYHACKTIETIAVALEKEFDNFNLLNVSKHSRKTTQRKSAPVPVDEGVFVLPEEFDLQDVEIRKRLVAAIQFLVENRKDVMAVTKPDNFVNSSTMKKISKEGDSEKASSNRKRKSPGAASDEEDECQIPRKKKPALNAEREWNFEYY